MEMVTRTSTDMTKVAKRKLRAEAQYWWTVRAGDFLQAFLCLKTIYVQLKHFQLYLLSEYTLLHSRLV